MSDARSEAARVLAAVLGGAALDAQWPASDARLADPRDRALARAIAYATLRGVFRFEAVLGALLERPLPSRERVVQAALLSGIAQLASGLTPDYAAVDGTVAALRVLGKPRHAALANAVLRRYQREGAQLLAGVVARDEQARLDHPQWLIRQLRAAWPDDADAVLAANNQPAPLWLRVNRRAQTREQAQQRLAAAGVATQVEPLAPDALRVDVPVDVASLPGFADGALSVQDAAAQVAVDALALAPGLRVLDACAAPGGKCAHALEREPSLDLLALDHQADRVARLRDTLTRLGLQPEARIADARDPAAWWDGRPFDRILIDAPCSGTGVIRRHPDIRLLRRESDLASLVALQDRLLDALWPLLARGGRLVYATCSVLPAENHERIAAFLDRRPDAVALDALPPAFGRVAGAGRQNLPGEHGMDGFFYAVLIHRA
jgi:16S rRNA (cytosine967-C5)-methyltransferase